MKDDTAKNIIPALERATQLLEVMSTNPQAHTVTDFANLLDIPVTTCFRILCTLEKADWIYPLPFGGYQLSAGLIRFLNPIHRYQALVQTIKPLLDTLSEETRRSLKISIRQGDEAVTIHRVEFPHPYSLNSRVGSRFPLVFGSSGAALLLDSSEKEIDALLKRAPATVWAHQTRKDFLNRLAECRAEGYCRDFGGFHPSIYTISAPVRNAAGTVECAVTLLGLHGDFMDKKQVDGYRSALSRCIEKAEAALESSRNDRKKVS